MIRGLRSPPPARCAGQRGVKTPSWLGRGDNRRHSHLLPCPWQGSELRTPRSPAATSRMSLLQDPAGGVAPGALWYQLGTPGRAATAALAPALILLRCGEGRVPARCGDGGRAQGLAGAAWQRAEAARQADVPRGCAVTSPALLVPHESAPRTQNSNIPTVPVALRPCPPCPAPGSPLTTKEIKEISKKKTQKNPKRSRASSQAWTRLFSRMGRRTRNSAQPARGFAARY